jgi:hypothetical protein
VAPSASFRGPTAQPLLPQPHVDRLERHADRQSQGYHDSIPSAATTAAVAQDRNPVRPGSSPGPPAASVLVPSRPALEAAERTPAAVRLPTPSSSTRMQSTPAPRHASPSLASSPGCLDHAWSLCPPVPRIRMPRTVRPSSRSLASIITRAPNPAKTYVRPDAGPSTTVLSNPRYSASSVEPGGLFADPCSGVKPRRS